MSHGVTLFLGYFNIRATEVFFKVHIDISNSVLKLQCPYLIWGILSVSYLSFTQARIISSFLYLIQSSRKPAPISLWAIKYSTEWSSVFFYVVTSVLRRGPRKGCGFSYLVPGSFSSPQSVWLCKCLSDRRLVSLTSINESEVLVTAASSAFSEVEALGHSSFFGANIQFGKRGQELAQSALSRWKGFW